MITLPQVKKKKTFWRRTKSWTKSILCQWYEQSEWRVSQASGAICTVSLVLRASGAICTVSRVSNLWLLPCEGNVRSAVYIVIKHLRCLYHYYIEFCCSRKCNFKGRRTYNFCSSLEAVRETLCRENIFHEFIIIYLVLFDTFAADVDVLSGSLYL